MLPRSTENRLVIPWCQNRGRYLLPSELKIPNYLNDDLRSEVSSETLIHIFQSLDREVKFRRARLDPKTHKFFSPSTIIGLVILLIGSVVCLLGYAFLLREIGLIYVFLVFLGLIFLGLGLRYLQVQKQEKGYLKARVRKYQEIITFLNKEYLKDRDFQIILGDNCDWLECCYDPRGISPKKFPVLDESYEVEMDRESDQDDGQGSHVQTAPVVEIKNELLRDGQQKLFLDRQVQSPSRVVLPSTPQKVMNPHYYTNNQKYGLTKEDASQFTVGSTATKYYSPEQKKVFGMGEPVNDYAPYSPNQVKVKILEQKSPGPSSRHLQPSYQQGGTTIDSNPHPYIIRSEGKPQNVARSVQIKSRSDMPHSFGQDIKSNPQVYFGQRNQYSNFIPKGKSFEQGSARKFQI